MLHNSNIKTKTKKSLNLVLLQITVPRESGKKEEESRDTKELTQIFGGRAEDFFASLYSIYEHSKDKSYYLSLEIVANKGDILFFIACPKELVSLVEKQVQSFYHDSQIDYLPDEYNLFYPGCKVVGASLKTKKKNYYPIRTFEELETDSLNTLTNALSKLSDGEAAAIQILIKPISNWKKHVNYVARQMQKGEDYSSGPVLKTISAVGSGVSGIFSGMLSGKSDGNNYEKQEDKRLTPSQEETVKAVGQKASKVGFETNIRIISVARTEVQAQTNLSSVLSGFSQFTAPLHNSFVRTKESSKKVVDNFILRFFNETALLKKNKFILNSQEIASIYHFPNMLVGTPNIKWLIARTYAAPSGIPKEGITLAKNIFRGVEQDVKIKNDDRRRHMYIIGKSGVGKSTFLVNMAVQDMKNGKGLCFVDPHGDVIEELLGKIPPERAEDVILFDPGDTSRPLGLNLFDFKTDDQKDFLVQEAINMLYKLYDPQHQGIMGPRFERWFRNAALLAMSDPAGAIFYDTAKCFIDDDFAQYKLRFCNNPIVRSFWEEEMAKTSERDKSEMLGWFTSKFDAFMSNDIMRRVLGQTKSGFDFRTVMDEGKILLVNLSKGKIGELNSALLGMIFVSKIQMAAMSRTDTPEDQRKDFYLYVDEFQNFSTDSFASILSEARKYRLSLITANQYIEQLDEKVRDAVFGNIGTIAVFTNGPQDAEFLVKYFKPIFTENDLVNIPKHTAYVRLLVENTTLPPFSVTTIRDATPLDIQKANAIKQLSRLKFGKDALQIEEDIKERYDVAKKWRAEKEKETEDLIKDVFKD